MGMGMDHRPVFLDKGPGPVAFGRIDAHIQELGLVIGGNLGQAVDVTVVFGLGGISIQIDAAGIFVYRVTSIAHRTHSS